MLRRVLIVLGVAALLLALISLLAHAYAASLYLLITGLVLTAGIMFERWRYAGTSKHGNGRWQKTDESFKDPVSGHSVEVYYNPQTGERHYEDKNNAG